MDGVNERPKPGAFTEVKKELTSRKKLWAILITIGVILLAIIIALAASLGSRKVSNGSIAKTKNDKTALSTLN